MAAASVQGDAWRVTGEERNKHDSQFFTLKPVNGFITGDQAKGFFMQSGLPTAVLGQIWGLADMNGDGKMDKKEFSIAMHLIKKKLQGYALPKALPATLKADPAPSLGSFGMSPMPTASVPAMGMTMSAQPMSMAPTGMGLPPMGMSQASIAMGSMSVASMPNGVPAVGMIPGGPVPPSYSAVVGPAGIDAQGKLDWSMPHQMKLKYTQGFNANDRNKRGYLLGVEARSILMQTGLPQNALAQIWTLSDIDKDGKLVCDEYCIAMHLVDLTRMGRPLPAMLPAELIPASMKAKIGSGPVMGFQPAVQSANMGLPQKDAFTELMGEMGMSAPVPPTINGESSQMKLEEDPHSFASFEDRRKENFDKGQAELEKRRLALQEQLQAEQRARQDKERAEQEKLEKQRQERERKKQMDFERQMEKQRQIEREREEQRQKIIEQRESARREMERQRQLEWERQRKEQLMTEKLREYEQLETLRSQNSNHRCELEALDLKKQEILQKVELVHKGVTDITSSIEMMRQSRDVKMASMEQSKRHVQEMNQKFLRLQQDHDRLDSQLQTAIRNNPMSETYHTVEHSVQHKTASIQMLKSQLEQIEKDTATSLDSIDQSNTQLGEMSRKVTNLESELSSIGHKQKESVSTYQKQDQVQKERHEKLKKELEAQRIRENQPNGEQSHQNAYFDDAFSQASQSTSSGQPQQNDIWGAAFANISNVTASIAAQKSKDVWGTDPFQGDQKSGSKEVLGWYKAIFEFHARNTDEIGLKIGDLIKVDSDQTGLEPGWLSGQKDGASGWFPEAFVEKMPNDSMTNSTEFSTSDSSNALQASVDSSFTAVQSRPAGGSPVEGQGEKAPEGLLAQAQYPWKAKKENHLSFNKGDIITVKEQQEMWWAGELCGKMGWFPKSYVKLVSGSSATGTKSSASSTPTSTPSGTLEKELRTTLNGSSEQFISLYAYTSTESSDLTFNQGDIITVTQNDGDWWTGSIGERSGIFPANYVQRFDVQDPSSSFGLDTTASTTASTTATTTTSAAATIISTDNITSEPTATDVEMSAAVFDNPLVQQPGSDDVVVADSTSGVSEAMQPGDPGGFEESLTAAFAQNSDTTDLASKPLDLHLQPTAAGAATQSSQRLGAKKPEIAIAIAAYTATGPEQLSLQPNQLIQIRKKSPSGWWEGELQARGQKRKIGWFPANYVKLKESSSSARSTPDPLRGLSSSPAPQAPEPSSLPPALSQPSYIEQLVALYPYSAMNPDELTFHKDSIINVINKDDASWWKGELNGSVGMFPSNYVGPLTSDAQTISSYNAASVNLETETPEENKRQNVIQELINTEETYVADMSIVLDVFYVPLEEASAFTSQELDSIFVNWKELIVCNSILLKALRVRKKMCGSFIYMIGDILCENLPHMTPYIRFCSCQLRAAALLQHKTETSLVLKEVHKKCVTDPRTKGMPLSSFLLKPMQRITKYPLIIKNILDKTPETHPDHQNLSDALVRAEELCSQVNEGVREQEMSDKLEWIQQHVQCDGLPEKITFNSVTNILGQRKFLHSGTLYKSKSNKELVAFLFNDFVLLTQPIRPLGSVVQVFSFDPKGTTQYRMYKTPLFLNELIVKRPGETEVDPTQFQLNHIDRVYSLKAGSTSERDAWVRKMETASHHYLETERKKRERAYTSEHRTQAVGRLLVILMEGINLATPHQIVRRTAGVGRLLVVLQEGCDLKRSDEYGKSDPYCEVSMGLQEHKTKVINNTVNPKWNASMQFTIKDVFQDVLCITVYDKDIFTPNDILGRTEVRVYDILHDSGEKKGPIIKRLLLHEVECGEVVVKLDLQLYENNL